MLPGTLRTAVNCKIHEDRVAEDFCLDCQVPLCVSCARLLGAGHYCARCFAPRFVRRQKLRRLSIFLVVLTIGGGGYALFESKKEANRIQARYGEHKARVAQLKVALSDDRCNNNVAMQLTQVLQVTENLEEARNVLTEVTLNCPPAAYVLNRLARLHRKLGEHEQALSVANQLIELRPNRAQGYGLRANLFEDNGRSEQAIDDLTRAADLEPTNREIVERLATLLSKADETCKAADVVDALLARARPVNAEVLRRRSNKWREAGQCARETVVGNQVTVPFEHVGNVMLVNVRINDKLDARMILDTGASSVALTRAAANKLALDMSTAKTLFVTTASGVSRAAQVQLDSVALGGARLEKVRAAVVDSMHLGEADGLLGNSFLSAFGVRVDSSNSRVILTTQGE